MTDATLKPSETPIRLAVAAWLGSYRALLRHRAILGDDDRAALRAAYFAARKVLVAVLLDRPRQSYADDAGIYSLVVGDAGQAPYPIWQPPLTEPAREVRPVRRAG